MSALGATSGDVQSAADPTDSTLLPKADRA